MFAGDADFGGDLIARNIQRGRDHGIPGFCCYYQLYVDSNFDCDDGWNDRYDDISQDNWSLLRDIYDRPSDIDLFTGGLAQEPNNGGLTGRVFQQMKCEFLPYLGNKKIRMGTTNIFTLAKICHQFIYSRYFLDNQFLRSKNGDRFFFTHRNQAGSFTRDARQTLINRTLSGIICDNTDITRVPEDAFKLVSRNQFISCDDTPKIDQGDIRELLRSGKS